MAQRFDYLLIRSAEQEALIEDGSETLICAEDSLDLAWFLEEEILLAMPMIAKHDDCLPPALADSTLVEQARSENPFAALKEILKAKEQP